MKLKILAPVSLTLFAWICCHPLWAQPAGWQFVKKIYIQERSATALSDYQVPIVINTEAPVSAGQMQPNGSDIRFGLDANGNTLLNYWIESGMNTASTLIWIKVPSLPAGGGVTIYLFYGNAAATGVSDIDGTFVGPHSATDSVSSGNNSSVGRSQRGFRFSPKEDILVRRFGKQEPDGTTRYVTLFDFAGRAILRQHQVSGPAGVYAYDDLNSPIWLTAGTHYLLEMYQDLFESYYWRTSSQIGQHLTYYDMRYCNSCDQNTFPTSSLGGLHYGYPDFHYYTKNTVNPAPTHDVCPVGNVIYVNAAATGANDGTSWTDAFTDLQSALSATCPDVTEIWVAAGTYKPTTGADRGISFSMKNGVAIYGGFLNTGNPGFADRNWVANVTTLSGDIGIPGDNSDNTYHVIRNSGLNNSSILDGFTVTGGRTPESFSYDGWGGGMYNDGGAPVIRNCTFTGNAAHANGGGMVNTNSNATIINCIFVGNSAGSNGGAVYSTGTPALINCTIVNNAGYGTIASNSPGSVSTLTNCIVLGDIYETNGGSAAVSYCITSGPFNGIGNLVADPLFVDAANGDLRLQACSPAIDAGTNTGAPIADFDGNARVDAIHGGNTADIGAYEFQGDLDADNDGYAYCNNADCNDNDGSRNPAAVEICDGIDNNCNGAIDDVLFISAPTHSTSGTTANWTVPAGGPYKVKITAKGAKGGRTTNQLGVNFPGGLGASMSGEFIVVSGQLIECVAGAPGQDAGLFLWAGGGGGGTGVQIGNAPLIIAGGGGGRAHSDFQGNATLAQNGNSGINLGSPFTSGSGGGGANGNGGGSGQYNTSSSSGGGGGAFSAGGNGSGPQLGGGSGYNASGGIGSSTSGGGGFGGGGGTIGSGGGGGGGGYSGGGGGGTETGGGGGSFNLGANPTGMVDNLAGGQVIIECLGTATLTATATPIQPGCAAPTQGSASIDLTDDLNGYTSGGLEYAVAAGGTFSGNPSFADVLADPFSIASGTGTVADADGETYTVRIRLKYNPTVFVDVTYTLTSPAPLHTWVGTLSTDWHTAGNWNPACVPTADDDVKIPDAANAPVIGAGTAAVAKSVQVQSDGSLTIAATGSLTINGSFDYGNGNTAGLRNEGTVSNSGYLVLGSTSSVGGYGIWNFANFTNNSDAEIAIDRSSTYGLYNDSGAFLNSAKITIGANSSVGNYGLWNRAAFTNNSDAEIAIDRSSYYGLYNDSGAFINSAKITIGAVADVGYYGLLNATTFTNDSDAEIAIDRSSLYGLVNQDTFINSAKIAIGAVAGAGFFGLLNSAAFTNNSGAEIAIDRSSFYGIVNQGPFINSAKITIGANNSVGFSGLLSSAAFTNNIGAEIAIDRSSYYGMVNQGPFINSAKITIGANNSIGFLGLLNSAVFTNNSGAEIAIDRSSTSGLYNPTGTFINSAKITIGANSSVGSYGLWNQSAFHNNACAELTSFAAIKNEGGITITNAGLFTVNTFDTHTNGGTFTNNGILSYPQGNPIPNVTNNEIIVAPTTSNDCQGVTPAFSLGSPVDFTIEGVYTDAAATQTAGTFSTAANMFTPTGGLTNGVAYDFFVKIEDAGGSCTRIVPWEVTVMDAVPPTISCPANSPFARNTNANFCTYAVQGAEFNPTAFNDNCTGATISNNFNNASTLDGALLPQGMTTVVWTVTDAVNLSTSCSIVVNVSDAQPPTITCPANTTVAAGAGCTAVLSDYRAGATTSDNCTANPTRTQSPAPGAIISGTQVLTLTAGDNSGNTANCTVTVTVVDVSAPTVVCKNAIVTLSNDGMAMVQPMAVFQSGSDNCDLIFLVSVSPNSFGVNQLGQHAVVLTVRDAANNTATCTAIVQVNRDISGRIIWKQDQSTGVKDVTVALSGDQSGNMTTAANGNYNFTLSNGSNFTLTPSKNLNKMNGINAQDVQRIQQHLSGNPIADPWQMLAADVNANNSITALDANILQLAILGNPSALAQMPKSWRFVPTSHVLSNPPWGCPEQISVAAPGNNFNFYGIKVGDLVAAYANPANSSAPPLLLTAQDQILQAGQVLTVDLHAGALRDLSALQFALGFDPEQLQLSGVESLGALPLTNEHLGTWQASEGSLRVLWSDVQSRGLTAGAPLLRLRFAVLAGGARLSEALQLDDAALPGLVFTDAGASAGVTLRYDAVTAAGQPAAAGLSLDNYPNPFTGYTTIRFELPQACEAQLRITDATGRLIAEHHAAYGAGRHEQRFELPASAGVLYCELKTPFGMVVRKMVLTE